MVQGFATGTIDLSQVNRADIIMIPKLEGANAVKDFRPISIINLLPKMISKLLVTRLAKFLPDLVSPNQTAFVQGRQILENFLATHEMLHHISVNKGHVVFLKINFVKTFDTLN